MEAGTLPDSRLRNRGLVPRLNINRIVGRRQCKSERFGWNVSHQWVPVLPNAGFGDLLGMVCIPSVDVVSRHARPCDFVVVDVERFGCCSNFLSSRKPNLPLWIQPSQHDGGHPDHADRLLFPLLFLESCH